MELKDKLVASFMAFEEKINDNAELHEVRSQAIKNFETKGFPTKKEEAWKYTSLNAILKNDFSVFPKHDNAIEFKDIIFDSSAQLYKIEYRKSYSLDARIKAVDNKQVVGVSDKKTIELR